MATREDCKWRHNPISDPVCHRCLGQIIIDNKQHCPFMVNGEPKPEFQHLVTAYERYYSIQLRSREGAKP